ncbi:MAG: hypothetical protein HY22_04620 [[Candidatus Thermochlorobacteriaceae] bacterium GBChlB]|nr:MAG: hypothetical protein HY22_04620 [[Candidatus Thermochlorobacteriaceae] bacterium GBChlB]
MTKHLMKVPKDRELRISVPKEISDDAIVEVTIAAKTSLEAYQAKVSMLQSAATDNLFLEDLKSMMSDFSDIDQENWEK